MKSIGHGSSTYEFPANKDEQHIVLAHEEDHSAEFVVADTENQVFMVGFEHFLENDRSTEGVKYARGLRVMGVSRRSGLFRRFVQASASEVLEGDKVVVEATDGSQYVTGKITSVQVI
jgi:hypothetical protein